MYIQCVISLKIRLQGSTLRCFPTTIKLCLQYIFFFNLRSVKQWFLTTFRDKLVTKTTILRCVKSQNGAYLIIYVAAETYEVTKSSSFLFVLKSVANIRRRKANWSGHIFRRNCLLQQVIEGKKRGDRSNRTTRKKT